MVYVKLVLLLTALLAVMPSHSGATGTPPSTVEITVEKDDFLIAICDRYLEKPSLWPRIARVNRLANPDRLKPGQKLLIPVDMLKGTPLEGSITFIKGRATSSIGSDSVPQVLSLGSKVKPGSEVRTSAESSVEISYEDGTSFILRDNSSVSVKAAKKTASHYLRQLFLSGGKIISRIKAATGRGSRNEIRTPSAVAEARGTVYRVSLDDRKTTRSEVLEGKIAVSSIAGAVSVKEGEGTFVPLNGIPSAPRKLVQPPEPADLQQLYRDLPIRISLRRTEGAALQGVVISRDTGGKDVLREETAAPTEVVEIDGLEDGYYTLRTFGLDTDGLEGIPSEPLEFQVRLNPLPPMLNAPSEDGKVFSSVVDLTWLQVKDAAKYHVQLAGDNQFSQMIAEEPAVDKTHLRIGNLPPGSYSFRARSIAEDGYAGKWSVVQEFTIVPPPPAPSAERPQVKGEAVFLRWAPVGRSALYQVQVSTDERFAQQVILDEKVKQPAISIPEPKQPGTYFVRVRGIEKEGREGDFSAPQSFTVERSFPYWSLGALGIIPLILIFAL